jgi:hypothetical protein
MRRAATLALVILASAACGAGVRWERPGGTEAERQRDEAECAGLANRDRSIPAQRGTMAGSSTRRGADGIELVTLRDFDTGVFGECMKARGYDQVPSRPPG